MTAPCRAPASAAAASHARRQLGGLLRHSTRDPPATDPVRRSGRKRKRAVPWAVEGPARQEAGTDAFARRAAAPRTLGTSLIVYAIHPLIHSSMGTLTRGPTRTQSATSCSLLPSPYRKATCACCNAAHRAERALVAVVHTLVGYRLLGPNCWSILS